jgi:hypothetical protein
MKLIALLIAVSGLACTVSPVITEPQNGGSDRYSDCRRAARDYCRHVLEVEDDGMKRCVANSTYECLAGGK